jgi:hypothetical protein
VAYFALLYRCFICFYLCDKLRQGVATYADKNPNFPQNIKYFKMKTLICLIVLFAVSCNAPVEPLPETVKQDSLIASDSVDTLLLIRTNKKDSIE